MVYYLVTALHVLVCVILILVVLLQSGKGADLASAFGGGATQTAFGSRGPASFLSKMTTIAAIVFMLTSMTLSSITTKSEAARSILETTGTSAPVKAPAAATKAQTPVQAPTPEQIKQQQMQIEAKQQQAQPGQSQPTAAPAPAQGATRSSTPAETKTPPPAAKKP